MTLTHFALTGALRRDRAARLAALELPEPLLPPVSAHRRRRGPYTAAGTVLRALVPEALSLRPELVAAHEVEILTAAPELRELVPARLETLTSLAAPEERTRYYSRLRTLRIAHGLAEFLRDLLAGGGPRSLVVEDAEAADPTDQELLAVLLRRLDPAVLTVVVGGTTGLYERPATPARPELPQGEELGPALRAHATLITAEPVPAEPAGGDPAELFVAGDGSTDDPGLLAGYAAAPVARRQELHDRRAAELAALAEPSLAFGALPYHLEHGSDPLGAGCAALVSALDTCMKLGFYQATVDFCERGRELTSWTEHPQLRWEFTTKLPTSLSALGRIDEAEAICEESRAALTNAQVHLQSAYTMAMIETRYRSERDHERGLAWINTAIAIAALLPDEKKRAFHTVFNNNGKALIEGHRGHPELALRLVSDGIAALDAELGPNEQQLHRSVLRHNRAQVLNGLGRREEALADYRAVIAADPYYPEYHFELATLLAKLGRVEEALAECETAMRLGPPFPEVHYNRGDLRSGLGDLDGALADFSYVLELDPGFTDARVNRAGIRLDLGELDAAEQDARAGLEREPEHAVLLAVLGRVHAEREDAAAALAAFDRALELDPDLVPALSGRAALTYAAGDLTAAAADLGRAVELDGSDPVLRFNRALVLRDAGRTAEALADLAAAAELAPGDEDIVAAQQECAALLTP